MEPVSFDFISFFHFVGLLSNLFLKEQNSWSQDVLIESLSGCIDFFCSYLFRMSHTPRASSSVAMGWRFVFVS